MGLRPLVLVRTRMGLRPQGLGFVCSKMELSHLVMDYKLPESFLCFCSNKSCHNTAPPPVCVSLKWVSYVTVRESCFHWQHYYIKQSQEYKKWWLQPQQTAWLQSHERYWARATQFRYYRRNSEKINVFCFKLLNLGGNLLYSNK